MNKKICVYAIAKNEIKFINRWFNSVNEADYVCVLDTGSTDGSFQKFQELNIITEQKIYKNFRFDIARNDSMKLIPKDADICVCVDIDEEFEKGWSKIIKENWKSNTGRATYRYTWNFNPDGSEGIVFMADKIHKNHDYIWKHPVHETLYQISSTPLETISLPNIQLNHRADNTKSRSSYLPLLELSVKEDPLNDRNVHYLGREYMFYSQYNKAIKTLKTHLQLPSSIWDIERCASLRYIANCYKHKKQPKKQEEYLLRAILEAPYVREPYFELALFYYEQNNYLKAAFIFNQMLKINQRYLNYMSSPTCWNETPHDYLSLCYYHLGDYKKAVEQTNLALNFSNNKRIKNNREIFINKLKNN